MEHEYIYWAPKKNFGRGWTCFKSSPDAPPAPDYVGAANATAAGSLEAAKQAAAANRVNQITPYGNLVYTQAPKGTDGKEGAWTATTSLSPEQKALMDMQNKTSIDLGRLQGSATDRVGSMMNSPAPQAYDPNKSTNNASELIMRRMAPQQERDRAALDNQLANQGIMRGSEAYNQAQDQIARQQTDAREQAELQGITLGQSQQAQQFQQEAANRNLPINELNALRTGSQVTNPSFNGGTPQQTVAQGANMLGALQGQSAYQQGLYNSEVATTNSNNGAAAGAAATLAAAYFM